MKNQSEINVYINELKKLGVVKVERYEPDVALKFTTKAGHVHYILEVKKHLANINIDSFIDALPRGFKILAAAPYIRKSQSEALTANGIDHFDMAGNVHISASGMLIHIEGKKPTKKLEQYKGRMLQKMGLQVLYILLTQGRSVHWPYRRIAEAANVVHGTVGWVIKDMRSQGFILGKGEHSKIVRKKELIGLWVQGYINTLRPKLIVSRYRSKAIDQALEQLDHGRISESSNFALTGSQAAYLLQRFYRDDKISFFAVSVGDSLAKNLEAVPDPGGTITHLHLFSERLIWRTRRKMPVSHPLVIYAELINDGTDRAKEAATMLYEKFLKEIEDEDR